MTLTVTLAALLIVAVAFAIKAGIDWLAERAAERVTEHAGDTKSLTGRVLILVAISITFAGGLVGDLILEAGKEDVTNVGTGDLIQKRNKEIYQQAKQAGLDAEREARRREAAQSIP
jgi:hypothetical protein